ncbi:nuclease-related domain-containing protein [Oceanobacillus sp. CAU 1775]
MKSEEEIYYIKERKSKMIIKYRKKPLLLEKYEILVSRLSQHSPHHSQVAFDATNCLKGYEGELAVDYYLKLLPAADYTILQDLTLKVNHQTFQMDNLILTRNAIYIVEVKNFLSSVSYHTASDTFVLNNGHRTFGTANPINQAKIQKERLRMWLSINNEPDLPIHCFAVISDSQTVLTIVGEPTENSLLLSHGEHIPWKIMELEKRYKETHNFPHQIIGYKLKNAATDFNKDILKEYSIHPNEIMPGIRCVGCNTLGMQRKGWTWKCKRCHVEDKLAAEKTINEYLLLIKPWITNKECQNFLVITSRNTCLGLLRKMPNLEFNKERYRWERK